MTLPIDNIIVLSIMVIYGLFSGGSAIILKIGIFRAGGIEIKNFIRDIGPAAWNLLTTPIWLLGGIIAVTGFLIYTVALNAYDVSVVKPLVNFNLLFTFIFAYIFFKEKLTRIEWVGIGILVAGLFLFAFSPTIDSTDIMNIPLLISLFPLTIVLIVTMVIIMFILRVGNAEFVFPIFSGIFFGLGTFFTKSLLIGLPQLNSGDLLLAGMFVYSVFMLILTYGCAIIAQQLAFERGRLSIVSPIANALSIIVAFIGAYFIFSEDIIVSIGGSFYIQSFFKIFGIICILIALIILRREIVLLQNSENGFS